MAAGTPPGGGLDRTARALAGALEKEKLVDVAVNVINMPGDGSRKIWTYLDRFPGDPHVLVVSNIIPRGPEACTNVIEFYYPEDIVLFEREFIEAERAAYHETAVEDREICERMTAGRKALYLQGQTDAGPYQSPMEDGMQHFHEFLRRELQKQN